MSAETETREILLGQAHGDPVMWDLARWREPLSQLYAKRGYAPLWVQPIGLTGAGQQLISELADAERRGLLTTDYDAAGLAQRVREMHDSGSATVASTMRVDLALSVAAARLASDLHDGRVRPADVGYDLDIPHPLFDAAQAVESLAASSNLGAALDAMEPQLRHYTLLKAALGKYRELDATSSALTALPPPPRFPVRAEDSYDGAPPLRRLLAALGDLRDSHDPGNSGRPGEPSAMPAVQSANDETRLDPSLVEGLKQFQLRHGLDADGILGRSTFRALTTPFATRIWQIELSLERVRWLPARLDSPPIIVNIPQFRLFAFRTTQDLAQDILQMNVIVGAAFKARQTPVFAAEMRYVVLQPYWDVPRSILVKELLPDIRARPGYLEKNGYEIVRGQSDSARPLPATPENVQLLAQGSLRLRQKPGPNNALGRVKFMFPNRHNVYLHDTPARSLFSLSSRAFSHGCIRVSDPMALLAHVMRNEPGWSEQKRDLALLGTTPVRWQLSKPIPVYIVYGTALATEAGAVMFFDDIYAQDAPLIARLTHRAG
ncbi:MAG: L,D-transpeptidase family protein [Gammaproteobacteria bacterium]